MWRNRLGNSHYLGKTYYAQLVSGSTFLCHAMSRPDRPVAGHAWTCNLKVKPKAKLLKIKNKLIHVPRVQQIGAQPQIIKQDHMEGIDKFALVSKILLDQHFFKSKNEDERPKLTFFWTKYNSSKLIPAMTFGNKFGPQCKCISCAWGLFFCNRLNRIQWTLHIQTLDWWESYHLWFYAWKKNVISLKTRLNVWFDSVYEKMFICSLCPQA